MQLKPIKGDYIFEQPKYGSLRSVFEVFNLWEEFECVVLEQNHRQGEDKEYAELLGRIRFKEKEESLSEEDLELLRSRCIPPVDDETTFQIFGKNASVNAVNEKRLKLQKSTLFTVEATHIPSRKNMVIKPAGTIEDTAFLQTLRIKVGARVMLIHNVNTLDGLTNGAQGTVVQILAKDNKVRFILVKFDNEDIGREQRRKFRYLSPVAANNTVTPIERFNLTYTLGDIRKDHGARASLLQFPLKLAWSSTAHKVR